MHDPRAPLTPALGVPADSLDEPSFAAVVGPDAAPIFRSDAPAPKKRGRRSLQTAKTREIVGLAIGARSLRAALVHEGLLVRVAEREIPEGIIERGMLLNPGALTAELKRFWKAAGLSTKDVNFAVSNRKVTLRTLDLPITENEEELQLAVMNMAPTVLEPIDPKKAIIDYAQLSLNGKRQQIQIAAADRQMIAQFVSAVEKAGLKPIACEIGAIAETRAIVTPRRLDAAQAVVNIGAELTSFVAASGPDVFFMRTVDIGGNDFTRAVMRTQDCAFDQAEELKRRAGLGSHPVDDTLDPAQFHDIQAALLSVCDQVAQAIVDSRRFYQQTPDGRPITGVVLLGGAARMPGLAEQLGLELGVDDIAEPRAREGLDGLRDPAAFAEAVGLAVGHTMSLLPDVKPVGFGLRIRGRRKLPKVSATAAKNQAKRLRARKKRAPAANPNLIAVALGAAALAGGYYYQGTLKGETETLRGDLDLATQQRAEIDKAGPTVQYTGSPAKIRYAEQAANTLRISPALGALSSLPAIIETNEINDVKVTVNGRSVTFTGAADHAGISQAIERALADIPAVSDIKAAPATPGDDGHRFTVTFQTRQFVAPSTPATPGSAAASSASAAPGSDVPAAPATQDAP